MNASRPIPEPPSARGPTLPCRPLAAFDAADLASVRQAFHGAISCSLGQAWQGEHSEGFSPAAVRTGWRHDTLVVYAELADADIVTQATRLNQRAWELGDAFEIFLRPAGQEGYVEFQVTPNNQRVQLRYANRAALDEARRTGTCDGAWISGEAFRSSVWLDSENACWHVLAEIPVQSVAADVRPLAGCRWHYSFSRYDYTRGNDTPVISSTSPHVVADFHRQQEWGELHFQPDNSPA